MSNCWVGLAKKRLVHPLVKASAASPVQALSSYPAFINEDGLVEPNPGVVRQADGTYITPRGAERERNWRDSREYATRVLGYDPVTRNRIIGTAGLASMHPLTWALAGVAAPHAGGALTRVAQVAKPIKAINNGVIRLGTTAFPKLAPYTQSLQKWLPRIGTAGLGARLFDVGTGWSHVDKSDSALSAGLKRTARTAASVAQLGNVGATALYSGANYLADRALSPYIRKKTSSLVSDQNIKDIMKGLSESDPKAYAALLLVGGAGYVALSSKGEMAKEVYERIKYKFPDKIPEAGVDFKSSYERGVRRLQEHLSKMMERQDNVVARNIGKTMIKHPKYFYDLFNRMQSGDYAKPVIKTQPFFAYKAVDDGVKDALKKYMWSEGGKLLDMPEEDLRMLGSGVLLGGKRVAKSINNDKKTDIAVDAKTDVETQQKGKK